MPQEFRSKLTKAADQREDEARGLELSAKMLRQRNAIPEVCSPIKIAVEEKRSSQSQSCF